MNINPMNIVYKPSKSHAIFLHVIYLVELCQLCKKCDTLIGLKVLSWLNLAAAGIFTYVFISLEGFGVPRSLLSTIQTMTTYNYFAQNIHGLLGHCHTFIFVGFHIHILHLKSAVIRTMIIMR